MKDNTKTTISMKNVTQLKKCVIGKILSREWTVNDPTLPITKKLS